MLVQRDQDCSLTAEIGAAQPKFPKPPDKARHVLIIAADFAPSSLPPALRIRFLANHLLEFGWKPTVLTTAHQYYDSAIDEENVRLLHESLRVIRTRALPSRLARKFGFGDIGMRSFWHHWKEARRICSTEHVDMVFISIPPYVSSVLGRLIRRRFGIPYVIDYIDPWVTECYWRFPRNQRPPKWPLAYAMSRLLEPFALRRASAIVAVSQGTIDGVRAQNEWLGDIPSGEIPYGGEPADFEYLRRHGRSQTIFNPNDGMLHVSYIGTCSPSFHPAVKAIFEAVRLGRERNPRLFNRVRIHFVGTTYATSKDQSVPQILHIARNCGISELVDEHPSRVPYLDSLQILLDSRALLVVGSEEAHYTASKVFPNILARQPLLAVFHENSSVVKILNDNKAGRVITFTERNPPATRVESISTQLEEMLSAPEATRVVDLPAAFEKYTVRAMAGRLASLFNRVLAGR